MARERVHERHRLGDVVGDVVTHYDVRDRSIGALISGQGSRTVKANEALTFRARQGQTLAIVGESGCGKSTFAKVLMGLETASEESTSIRMWIVRPPNSSLTTRLSQT